MTIAIRTLVQLATQATLIPIDADSPNCVYLPRKCYASRTIRTESLDLSDSVLITARRSAEARPALLLLYTIIEIHLVF